MRTSSTSLAAEDGDTRLQARHGLIIYFAIAVPLTAVFEAIVILTGNLLWIMPLMWTLAAASVVARLVLREGFADVSSASGGLGDGR